MNFFAFLYKIVLGPLELLFDSVFSLIYYVTLDKAVSIVTLSLAVNFLILPLYRRADALQEEERLRNEKLSPGVTHIKKVFKGDERFMMLQTYYRQNDYKPYYALRGSLSLLLEIPFFIAAYNYLSNLKELNGASLGPIQNLGQPDGLLNIAGHAINLLPILMTAINIISGIIYTKGMPLKSKIQLYGIALIFLLFLYSSPSGLVFYWTLNNLFSLVKNLFYKFKNPKLIVYITCFAVSFLMLHHVIFVKPMITLKRQVFVIGCILLLCVPLVVYLTKKAFKISRKVTEATKTDHIIFYACVIFMTFLTGVLIPSAVIKASPEEFISISDFHTPLRYVVHSFALAAGTFMVWMNIFFRLSDSPSRKKLSLCSVIISCCAAVNYMFFGKNYGNMSSLLQYDNIMEGAKSDYFINTAVLILLAVALFLLWKKRDVAVQSLSLALCAAVIIMSGVNVVSIQLSTNKMSQSLQSVRTNQGITLPLDQKGQNVIVIMMDRAINEYFPYIIEERPELKEQFAGFTYYPNTISYGNCTMLGSSGLFGGYEYIPDEMNKRDSETIAAKHDESLKVMPVLFSQNGFETTVCDPPFAGFQWISNIGIYNNYPEINKYLTKEKFVDDSSMEQTDSLRNRNFFAYSIMRSSPVVAHLTLYNKGLYNHCGTESGQVIDDMYTAHGSLDSVDSLFTGSYSVLKKLPELTDIRSSGKNTFLMIDNDSTHDVVMLQEPQYETADPVDNRQYEAEHGVRRNADGDEMTFTTAKQIMHYQCNMAAMIKLGQWMDYLRENNVYDNTKIIIVSDHGKDLDYLFGEHITNGKENLSRTEDDVILYKALLLVKDFGSTELTTDNTFMTNADTPSLACEGLIDNPVNPFTNKKITMDDKNKEEHFIGNSEIYNPYDYKEGETQFKEIKWLGFKGTDSSDLNAWRIIGDSLD